MLIIKPCLERFIFFSPRLTIYIIVKTVKNRRMDESYILLCSITEKYSLTT